jgi:hypothetical protein
MWVGKAWGIAVALFGQILARGKERKCRLGRGIGRCFSRCVTALLSLLPRLPLPLRTLPTSDNEGRTAVQAAAWRDDGSLEPVLLPKARGTERAAKVHRTSMDRAYRDPDPPA